MRPATAWNQQAYIKASNTDANDLFGSVLSLSADTLAVGVSDEDSNATGINGNEKEIGDEDFKPAQYYLDKCGYNFTGSRSVPYTVKPGEKVRVYTPQKPIK